MPDPPATGPEMKTAHDHFEKEDYQQALSAFAAVIKQQPMSIEAHWMLGLTREKRGDLGAAEKLLLKAQSLARDQKNNRFVPAISAGLGRVYSGLKSFDKSEQMFRHAIACYEETGNQPEAATCFGQLGMLAGKRGDLDTAESLLLKCLAMLQKSGCDDEIGAAYGNLAIVYRQQGKLDQAAGMIIKSIPAKDMPTSEQNTAASYTNLAVIYAAQGKADQAEATYKQAYAIYKRLLFKVPLAQITSRLAKLAVDRNDLAEARDWFIESRDWFIDLKKTREAGLVQRTLDMIEKLLP